MSSTTLLTIQNRFSLQSVHRIIKYTRACNIWDESVLFDVNISMQFYNAVLRFRFVSQKEKEKRKQEKKRKNEKKKENEKESRESKRNFRRYREEEFADRRDAFQNLRDVQFRSEAKDELTKNAAGLRLPAEFFSEFSRTACEFLQHARTTMRASDRFRWKRKIDRT